MVLKFTPLTKGDVPERRRVGFEPIEIPDTLAMKDGGESLPLDSSNNPLVKLGLMASGGTARFLDTERLSAYGLVYPAGERGGVHYEGGGLAPNDTGKLLNSINERNPNSDGPLQVGETMLTGRLTEFTPQHETMHQALVFIKNRFSQEEFGAKYGEDFAQVVYGDEGNHPLIQAILNADGKSSFNDYFEIEKLTPEDIQLTYRAIQPVFDVALEILKENNVVLDKAKPESPEDEASRKNMLSQEDAVGFLEGLKDMLFGGRF